MVGKISIFFFRFSWFTEIVKNLGGFFRVSNVPGRQNAIGYNTLWRWTKLAASDICLRVGSTLIHPFHMTPCCRIFHVHHLVQSLGQPCWCFKTSSNCIKQQCCIWSMTNVSIVNFRSENSFHSSPRCWNENRKRVPSRFWLCLMRQRCFWPQAMIYRVHRTIAIVAKHIGLL